MKFKAKKVHASGKEVVEELTMEQVNNMMLSAGFMTMLKRTKIGEKMARHGIETRPVFYPLNHMPMYRENAPNGTPVADKISRCGLVLPMHAALTNDDVLYVCQTLREVLNA